MYAPVVSAGGQRAGSDVGENRGGDASEVGELAEGEARGDSVWCRSPQRSPHEACSRWRHAAGTAGECEDGS
jgi:hypothetical protein